MALDIEQLRLLAQIVQVGSLSRAALLRGTRQSAISRQVAAMEADSGARLLHRTGRGVRLTELGELMMPRIRALLADADRLADDIRGTARTPVGKVNLGMMASTARVLAGPLYDALRNRYPGITLRVYEGSATQLDEWVGAGRVEIALLHRRDRRVARDAERLGDAVMHLIGAPGDPLTRGATCRFRRLRDLPLVLPAPPSPLRAMLDRAAADAGFRLDVVVEADSANVQTAVVMSGRAWSVIGGASVAPEVAMGRLQAALIVEPRIERAILMVSATPHSASMAARAVAAEIRTLFAAHADAFTQVKAAG